MKLIWLTDIHLNFLEEEALMAFFQTINNSGADAILLSGDIAEAENIDAYLYEMAKQIEIPIYFVLGNHDYYKGNINDVRACVTELREERDELIYLPSAGYQQLDEDTVLVGQDGWADGRLGDFAHSTRSLNDSVYIEDLAEANELGRDALLHKMQELADTDAAALKADLTKALAQEHLPKKVIIVTHVPPFKEACMYRGKQTEDDYLPFFTSKATGDVLMEFAQQYPGVEFNVYSGHTHHPASCQPLKNLHVRAGKAEYHKPTYQDEMIELGSKQKLKM